MPPRLPDELGKQLVASYLSGMTTRDVAKKHGVHPTSVSDWVKRLGYTIRSWKDSRQPRSLNENVFENPSDEAAYWIGFILADGCVTIRLKPTRSYYLRIGLAEGDKAHLEAFKVFVKSDAVIATQTRKSGFPGSRYCRLAISSKKLVEDLAAFGIHPRKSFTSTVPPSLADNRHFWRGVVDGDGFIFFANRKPNPIPTIGLTGSLAICEGFKSFVLKYVPSTNPAISKNHSIWAVRFSGRFAAAVCGLLYTSTGPALARKLAAANAITSLSRPA